MTSTYEDIYSTFLSKITDQSLLSLDESIIKEMMNGWMKSAPANPYINRLFSSISFGEDSVTYELSNPADNVEMERLYVEDVIARGMVIAWLEPRVKSITNLLQMYSGKEAKWFSQAQHLAELRGMLEDEKKDLRRLINDHTTLNNDYLED